MELAYTFIVIGESFIHACFTYYSVNSDSDREVDNETQKKSI